MRINKIKHLTLVDFQQMAHEDAARVKMLLITYLYVHLNEQFNPVPEFQIEKCVESYNWRIHVKIHGHAFLCELIEDLSDWFPFESMITEIKLWT